MASRSFILMVLCFSIALIASAAFGQVADAGGDCKLLLSEKAAAACNAPPAPTPKKT